MGNCHHKAHSLVAPDTLGAVMHLDCSGCTVIVKERQASSTDAAVDDIAEGLAECQAWDGLSGGSDVDGNWMGVFPALCRRGCIHCQLYL